MKKLRPPFAVRAAALAVPALLAAVTAVPVAAQSADAPAAGAKRLTLESLRGVRYRPAPGVSLRWGPDGKLLRVTDATGEKPVRSWREPETWKRIKRKPAAEGGAERAAAGANGRDPRAAAARPASDPKPAGAELGPAASKRVAVVDGQVVLAPRAGRVDPNTVTKLTKDARSKREVNASKDGWAVSFVADHDLVVHDLRTKAEWRVTEDGSDELFNGVLDWVYQEEIYGRGDFQAHWWSPSSDAIAFLKLDESPVKEFTVVDFVPEKRLADERAVVAEVTNYPKAGDPNPNVELHVARLADRSTVRVDLSKYPAEDEILIVNVGWSPAGDRVVFQVQNRVQTWLDLNVADPATGAVTTLFRETSPTWVNVLGAPRWLDDGSFLWSSERTGYRHLYRYAADGQLMNRVTTGDWPASRTLRVDEGRGLLWFTGTGPDSALDRHAFRVGLDGTGQVQLTAGAGAHSVSLNHDGSLFVDSHSSISVPSATRVCDGDGKVLREFKSDTIPDAKTYGFSKKELHRIAARDGRLLDATVIQPHDFDPNTAYPVWIETYSGPNAPSVRNSWSYSAWHQFLAQEGYVVFQVNVRSASGGGQVTTGACYEQLGVTELRDLEDAVKWLTDHRWADAERVGLYGWSYGGFMTAFALTHSKAFKLGIAGAGVYDWQLYDTIYTERYMDTPQRNAAGYARSSVLAAAADLHGHLLMLHGVKDDNVHLQNAMRLAYELQIAGKSFDMMLYPTNRHGIRNRQQNAHMRRLMWDTIRTVL